jgi:thiamine kinase-like enzyme
VDLEHTLVDSDTIPDSLLMRLRTLHRFQPDALDGDLPEFGLMQLSGDLTNRVYRWTGPRGPICVKLYRTDKRDRARCEWKALRHLAEHSVTATNLPLWHDPHPTLPAVGMNLVPGLPVTTLTEPTSALPAIATVLRQIRELPLGPFASLGRLDSADDFIRCITITWPEQLRQYHHEPITRELIQLIRAWHDHGDDAVLAEPAPRVFSHGDGNLGDWRWHEVTSAVYVLDWELAGHSDVAYDTADLIEHPSARAIDDQVWLDLLPDLGVDDPRTRRRFAAARRTVALRWLAIHWQRRHEDSPAFEHQLRRARTLVADTEIDSPIGSATTILVHQEAPC